jgi:hypothetical protein
MEYVKEHMDEKKFYTILMWAGIRATVAMLVLLGTGFVIIPSVIQYATPGFGLSSIATVAVMLYVFRTDLVSVWGKVAGTTGAIAYFLVMYIGGEVVFFGLILMGILVVAFFIAGDAIIAGVLTYRDLTEWVEDSKRAEVYRLERDAKKIESEGA